MHPFRLLTTLLIAGALLTAGPALADPGSALPNDPAMQRRVSASIDGMPLGDAIKMLAQKGRLNVIIQDDLRDPVSADFRNAKLADALESLLEMGGAQAFSRGGILVVVGRRKAFDRGMAIAHAQVIPLRYASATRIAEFLNSTAIARSYGGSGGSGGFELAKADPRANAVLVMGGPTEIAFARRAIAALDAPVLDRIFKLSHANAVEVAALLNASLFNNGGKGPIETIRAEVESTTDGQGGVQTGTGLQLGQASSSVRSRNAATQALPVEGRTPLAIPDTRTNAVIVLGSSEMLEAAASLIGRLDKPVSQVSITVEVIEVNSQDALELGAAFTGASGAVTTGMDPAAPTTPGWSLTYDPTSAAQLAWRVKLNALVRDRKARLVAHPTILASDNTEAQINIVDEVIKGTKISNQGLSVGGQTLVVVEPIFGAAGVMLNILPKIGADGRVTMRLHPTVSSVRETQKDSLNNTITLLSRRELVAQQVIVPSGTSLALGGLTQTNQLRQANKLPLLGELPLLGALFGQNSWNNTSTELMILVTPRILKDPPAGASTAPSPAPAGKRP